VDGEVQAEAIPNIALAVVERVPRLISATLDQTQEIFDTLIGALAARGIARSTVKTARFLA
jgi:hypothetical protein